MAAEHGAVSERSMGCDDGQVVLAGTERRPIMATRQSRKLRRLFRRAAECGARERRIIPGEPARDRVAGYVERQHAYAINGKVPRFVESSDVFFRWASLYWPAPFWPVV